MKMFYEIMHGDDKVAVLSTDGKCQIHLEDFMPYNLFLDDEGSDFEMCIRDRIYLHLQGRIYQYPS